MPQKQEKRPKAKRKTKKEEKLEFDPGMVFDVEPAADLEILQDEDLARFKARKGQGGDRRHSGGGPESSTPVLGMGGLTTV